jgi:hypothetical protein
MCHFFSDGYCNSNHAAIESSFAMDLEPALKAGGDSEKSFGQIVN